MKPEQVTLRAEGLRAYAHHRSQAEPVIHTGDHTCRAPFPGPATFVRSIVLPKTARITGGEVLAEGSPTTTYRLNGHALPPPQPHLDEPEALPAIRLKLEHFSGARDFEIPELNFCDFVRHELEITVQAPENEAPELFFLGFVRYDLPEESAAAYLTYVMTQA